MALERFVFSTRDKARIAATAPKTMDFVVGFGCASNLSRYSSRDEIAVPASLLAGILLLWGIELGRIVS
jgi:hypothetical protein